MSLKNKTMNIARIMAVLTLLALSFTTSAATPAVDKLKPGASYYYDNFDPEQRPWKPGQSLNIEEVFKNYQYYEILLDRNGSEITVHHFIRGEKADSKKYLILPDGSLQKK